MRSYYCYAGPKADKNVYLRKEDPGRWKDVVYGQDGRIFHFADLGSSTSF